MKKRKANGVGSDFWGSDEVTRLRSAPATFNAFEGKRNNSTTVNSNGSAVSPKSVKRRREKRSSTTTSTRAAAARASSRSRSASAHFFEVGGLAIDFESIALLLHLFHVMASMKRDYALSDNISVG